MEGLEQGTSVGSAGAGTCAPLITHCSQWHSSSPQVPCPAGGPSGPGKEQTSTVGCGERLGAAWAQGRYPYPWQRVALNGL